MKQAFVVMACVVLAGCDYALPLVKTATQPLDRAVVGLWQAARTNDTEALLVLPLDEHQYMVSYPAGAKDAMFAKGRLCQVGGRAMVQLDWFGTAQGTLPDSPEVYQFATYTVKGDELTVRLLNPEVVRKDVASSEELAKRIAGNLGKVECFREAMVFRRAGGK